MLFRTLSASPALDLQSYADIDHFRESERYVQAQSIPLTAREFPVKRATLALPSCRLSLVRTFPRIINGYELSGRLMVVVPMDKVGSTRVNGREIGQALLLLKGSVNCTVLEPESRLVAILSIDTSILDQGRFDFDDGFVLLRLPAAELIGLQASISNILGLAATEPGPMTAADLCKRTEDTLLADLELALQSGETAASASREPFDRYKLIVDRVDELVGSSPIDLSNDRLADAVGVSVRTLQKAALTVCGSGVYRYGRLRRLWSVRRQLRTGAPGLTVKASALAHGFWHQSEFSNAYRAAFGELPSRTLEQARVARG